MRKTAQLANGTLYQLVAVLSGVSGLEVPAPKTEVELMESAMAHWNTLLDGKVVDAEKMMNAHRKVILVK